MAEAMRAALARALGREVPATLEHRSFRDGDIHHSLADISKARTMLGYVPTHDVAAGLEATMAWYAACDTRPAAGERRVG